MSYTAEILDFFDRHQESLRFLELELMALPKGETANIQDALRHIVSLEADAKFLNLQLIESLAHYLTQYLKLIRDHSIKVDQELTTNLLKLFDCLENTIIYSSEIIPDEKRQSSIEKESQQLASIIQSTINKLSQKYQLFQEIGEIFPLESAVKTIAEKEGKQATAIIIAGEVSIPERILRHLRSILPHLINNAIAHGIEFPEERKALGKSPVGLITLKVKPSSENVTIIFTDDGAGINQKKVKDKAIQKGIITVNKAAKLTESEVYELLCNPDFSTKEDQERNLTSGLGFGLNIIKTSIVEHHGNLKILSQLGQGTTFEINYSLNED